MSRENLHEGQGLRRNFKFPKFSREKAKALKDLIRMTWESKCSNAKGILLLPEQEKDDFIEKISLSEVFFI